MSRPSRNASSQPQVRYGIGQIFGKQHHSYVKFRSLAPALRARAAEKFLASA
jgi:hypothetical protein